MTPEQDAVADAYRRNRLRLIGLAAVTVDRPDAEDIVHDAVLKALASADGCRGDVLPWLMAIVRNTAVNARRRQATAEKFAPLLLLPDVPSPEDDVAEALDRTRLAAAAALAVGRLPRGQQAAITALAEHGTLKDSAAALGMGVSTFKAHVLRARRRLRGALEAA